MTQCNRNRRVRACSATLILLLAAGGLASCGGSSGKTPGTAASAGAASPSSSTSTPTNPASASTGGNGGTAGPSGTAQGSGSKSDAPSSSSPIVRASSFVTCMRAHGVQLANATGSKGSATLDLKGVNTHSAQYKNAITACARELLGKLTARTSKGKKIRVQGIRVKGIKLKSIHIGHIEIPNIHVKLPALTVPGVTVPKVTTPTPNYGGGSGGEAPTQPGEA